MQGSIVFTLWISNSRRVEREVLRAVPRLRQLRSFAWFGEPVNWDSVSQNLIRALDTHCPALRVLVVP